MPRLTVDWLQEVLDDLLADGAGEEDLGVQDLRRQIELAQGQSGAPEPPALGRSLAQLQPPRKPE